MIEERALVTALDGRFAQVEARPVSACGNCQAGPACGTSLLNKLFSNRKVKIRALNPISAAPGEQVIVGVDESDLTQASAIFYLQPILLLIVFAGCFGWLADTTNLAAAEPASIFGGLLGLLIGLAWARRNLARRNADDYHVVILRRAGQFEVEVGR